MFKCKIKLRNSISVILSVLIVLSAAMCVPVTASAATYDSNPDDYTLCNRNDNDKTAEIYSYIGDSEYIEFPSMIDGYKVTAINADFEDNQKLKGVIIPDTIEYVSYGLFSGCTSLTDVKLGKNLKNITGWMFEDCTNLKNIEIGNNVSKIGEYAFLNCKSLRNIIIPSSVQNIGVSAFYGCTNLKRMTIPSNTYLEDNSIGYYSNNGNDCPLPDFVIVGDINSYAQRYANDNGFKFEKYTVTSFTDSGVTANKTETYTIRCIDSNGNTVSSYNSTGWSKKYTASTPSISKLENTSSGIKLSWNKVTGAYGYRLYRKTSSGWKRIKDTTATTYTDSAVKSGRTETYTIRCIDKNGNTVSGYNSKGWSKKYVYNPPKSIKLNKTSAYIGKKESVTLKYTLSAGSTSTVTWSSSNKNVATVSGGKVTAKGAGTTTITATTANGKKATCKVTVINGERKHLYVNSYRVRVCDFSVVVPDSCTVVYGNDCVVFVDKYNKTKYGSGTLMWVTFSGRYNETKEYYLGKINGAKIVYQYPIGAGVGNVLDKTASQKYQDSLKNMELSIKNTFRFE